MKKSIIFGGMVALTACGVAWLFSDRHQPAHKAALPPVKTMAAVRPQPPLAEVSTNPANEPVVRPPEPDAPKTVKTQMPETSAPDPRWSDPAVKEALGRLALSFVGYDPAAEEVWLLTINDPTLPDESRKNLIEDLNEDGLSDPQNPGPQDLPLIMNRLRLIAQLAPYAMDQINRDAFMEAGKDLYQMYADLTH